MDRNQIAALQRGDYLVTVDGWAWEVRSDPYLENRRLKVTARRSDGRMARILHRLNSDDVVEIYGRGPVVRTTLVVVK